jgi:hypothetical protein
MITFKFGEGVDEGIKGVKGVDEDDDGCLKKKYMTATKTKPSIIRFIEFFIIYII